MKFKETLGDKYFKTFEKFKNGKISKEKWKEKNRLFVGKLLSDNYGQAIVS